MIRTGENGGVASERNFTDTSTPEDTSAPSAPNTVFLVGDDKLTNMALQALSPQRGSWSAASAAAMSDAVILMVDDEQLNIEMTEAFLAEAGYRKFAWTADPRNALELMRSVRPGVVLLDLNMPHVSGLDILAAMREDAQLRHLPVIVLTGTTDPEVKLQALSAGAMDFLSKPVDPSELALRIRNTLAASAYRIFLAQHDPLTGLANKALFLQDIGPVMDAARSGRHSGALLHIGIDRLGPINDALGRFVGDQLVQRFAKRLMHCVETELNGELGAGGFSPTLYRLDGDEFAVIVPYVEAREPFAAFISRLMEAASFGFARGGRDLFVTASMGIAVFPQDAREAPELSTNAGLALRQAKEAGRNGYEFFSSRFNETAAKRLATGADLRGAFGRDEIVLLYQPVVEVSSGRLVGAEAVLRWDRPGGEPVLGDELMALAASVDMAVPLTEWMIELVMDHIGRWSRAGLTPVPVTVIVSLAHFRTRDLLIAARKAQRSGIKPGQLCVGLQFAPALDALTQGDIDHLNQVRAAGVRIALAGLGGAGASLQILRRLQLDEARLAPALLADLSAPGAPELLRGIVALLGHVQVPVVACGVDTPLQRVLLKNLQVVHCQGGLVGGPAGGMNFAMKWLVRRPKPPAGAG